jgi:hypothetical protein
MTAAPATTAPLGSKTVPKILAVELAQADGHETRKKIASRPASTALQVLVDPRNSLSGVIIMIASIYATQSQQVP